MRKKRLLRVSAMIIAFALLASPTFAQQRIVTGMITDQNRAALANASIRAQGEKVVTSSDFNCKFKKVNPLQRRHEHFSTGNELRQCHCFSIHDAGKTVYYDNIIFIQ